MRKEIGTRLGACAALILLAGCAEEAPFEGKLTPPPAIPMIPSWGDEPPLYYVRPASVTDLLEMQDWYVKKNGKLRVPNVTPISFPEGLEQLPAPIRKRIFFRSLLPLALYGNSRVERERRRLLDVMDPAGLVSPTEAQAWLSQLMKEYRVRRPARMPLTLSERLLPRVDVIPVELVLAQAAIESGWGTSRFFRLGRSVFGEWTHDPSASGIVPAERDSGATHRVRSFRTLLGSLRAYMRNLNTHPAYQEFRAIRSRYRRMEDPLDPVTLASTLTLYSARGQDYIEDLQTILREPELAECADAELYSVGLTFVTRFEIVEVEAPWGTIAAWPQ